MKNQIKFVAFVLIGLLSTEPSQARPLTNTRCMPAVLEFVMQDFDQTIQSTGLIVQNPDGKLPTLLGNTITYDSVTITDVHKNSYKIEIPLQSIDSASTDLIVWTYVIIDSYNNCKIFDEKPVYAVYKRRD